MWTFIAVFFLILAVFIVFIVLGVIQKIKQEKISAFKVIADNINDYANGLNTAKTTKTKLKYCEKALSELHRAETLDDNYKTIFPEHGQLFKKFAALEVVLPVMDHLNKAHKNRFKQKNAAEKNNLLDALYEIKEKAIHDEDFVVADLRNEETGELTTISGIETRLKELGWEPKTQQSA